MYLYIKINTNMTQNIINTLEELIKDTSRQSPASRFNDGKFLTCLNNASFFVYEKISWGGPGKMEYYGIGYEIFDNRDRAFYKSLEGEIYAIECTVNGDPISYYKL